MYRNPGIKKSSCFFFYCTEKESDPPNLPLTSLVTATMLKTLNVYSEKDFQNQKFQQGYLKR